MRTDPETIALARDLSRIAGEVAERERHVAHRVALALVALAAHIAAHDPRSLRWP